MAKNAVGENRKYWGILPLTERIKLATGIAIARTEQYSYEVRGQEITGDNYRESLSKLQIPKIGMPRDADWGELPEGNNGLGLVFLGITSDHLIGVDGLDAETYKKIKAKKRSQQLKYHIQTSGRSLHAQEIQINDIRTTLQALYALFDNYNSLHTNAYDEAITTPTPESVRRDVAIQMISNLPSRGGVLGAYLAQ